MPRLVTLEEQQSQGSMPFNRSISQDRGSAYSHNSRTFMPQQAISPRNNYASIGMSPQPTLGKVLNLPEINGNNTPIRGHWFLQELTKPSLGRQTEIGSPQILDAPYTAAEHAA
jgi:hypothetical protein